MVLTMMFPFDSASQNMIEHLSATSQRSSSASIMILPSSITPLESRGYRAIAPPLIKCCRRNTSHRFCHSLGSGLSSTENPAYLLLHHPFCLVMLLFDCILLKPLDIKCHGQHQHVCLFQVLIEFIMRNAILAPRWVAMSSTTSFDSPPMQAWSCISYSLPLGRIYTCYLCIITPSFPLICLIW